MTSNEATSTTDMLTLMDFLTTVTGYEEEAIESAFGRDIDSLPFGRQIRACAFVRRIRDEAEPVKARAEVMSMPIGDIFQEFADLADPGEDNDGLAEKPTPRKRAAKKAAATPAGNA